MLEPKKREAGRSVGTDETPTRESAAIRCGGDAF
jgi:hypothetical protein